MLAASPNPQFHVMDSDGMHGSFMLKNVEPCCSINGKEAIP